jgi:hypothetical protein
MNAFERNLEKDKAPPLEQMLNVYQILLTSSLIYHPSLFILSLIFSFDFKAVAKKAMTKDAWDYYESGTLPFLFKELAFFPTV